MKYYTQQDLEDACAFISGWTMGAYKSGDLFKGQIGERVVKEVKERFKPRDIRDLIEYPLKKEKT